MSWDDRRFINTRATSWRRNGGIRRKPTSLSFTLRTYLRVLLVVSYIRRIRQVAYVRNNDRNNIRNGMAATNEALFVLFGRRIHIPTHLAVFFLAFFHSQLVRSNIRQINARNIIVFSPRRDAESIDVLRVYTHTSAHDI